MDVALTMIRLFYSNRTEALLKRLAENVSDQRNSGGPWETVHIVVPNAHVEDFLKVGLAQHLGIAANLRFRFLDGLYRFSLPEADPPLRILDRSTLQGALLHCFQDAEFSARSDLKSLRNYLGQELTGNRAVQLSGELARLFEEYTLSRPTWARRWLDDQAANTGAPTDLETWQRILWKHCREVLSNTSFQWITLPEYMDPARDWVECTTFPPRIHVFGLSHVAQAYHQAFQRIGAHAELMVYTLNPCAEFWDDLETETEARRRSPLEKGANPDLNSEDPFGLSAAQDCRALQLWARPGRENIRMLNQLLEYDFESEFPDAPVDTLLEQIQEDIRLRRGTPELADMHADGSLRVIACPSLRREAEVIADEIWDALEVAKHRGTPLRFSEMAIIMPSSQKARCVAHLKTAFEAAHGIPWVDVDGASEMLASLCELAALLLKLPQSDLNRAEVMKVLLHPAFLETLPETDAESWPQWCERAGIVRGANAEALAGSYVEHDRLNWDQGLRRLALGAFLPEGIPFDGSTETYDPVSGLDLQELPVFLRLARSLTEDATCLKRLRMDADAWAQRLIEYLDAYLDEASEIQIESRARALQKIRKAVGTLRERAVEGMPPAILDFEGALELALGTIESAMVEPTTRLTQGVVLASYLPMRAIPYKVIFLMGLGEGIFPVRDARNPLDLRSFRRMAGDVSPAERDRYLFLEMLLCARQRLVLSYVNRDEISGAELEPSSVVRELLGIASAHVMESERKGLVLHVPLHRYANETSLRAPGARLEAQARHWGNELRSKLNNETRFEEWTSAARTAVNELLNALPTPDATSAHATDVALSGLRKWLECPLQGAALVRLGLRSETQEDVSELEEESLRTSGRHRRWLLRRSLWDSLRGVGALDLRYRHRRSHLEALGQVPSGLLAEEEIRRDLELLSTWHDLLVDGSLEVHRFGEVAEGELPPTALHRSLILGLVRSDPEIRLRLSGLTEPQWCGGGLILSERRASDPAFDGQRFTLNEKLGLLKSYLDQVVLTASGVKEGAHCAWICTAGASNQIGLARIELPNLDRERATRILVDWLNTLFGNPHPYAIPIEAVLEDADDLEAWMQQRRENGVGFSSLYGPISRPEDHLPPVELDWKDLVHRRLPGFFQVITPRVAS